MPSDSDDQSRCFKFRIPAANLDSHAGGTGVTVTVTVTGTVTATLTVTRRDRRGAALTSHPVAGPQWAAGTGRRDRAGPSGSESESRAMRGPAPGDRATRSTRAGRGRPAPGKPERARRRAQARARARDLGQIIAAAIMMATTKAAAH